MRASAACFALGVLLAGAVAPAAGASIRAGHRAADAFEDIPASYFQSVRDHYRFLYARTSHGSQVNAGMDMLADEDPLRFAPLPMIPATTDLGYYGDTSFVTFTREYLASDPSCNAVMWAWCGGLSVNTPEGVDAYLQGMSRLEAEYPGVLFIYMTGHLDGTGPAGVLERNNDQIRAWCEANGKVLFDFADIERYDPDGVDHPDDTDACLWCGTWCETNPCPSCPDCAHSHCLNCYRKGRAFWWLMARTLGWLPADVLGSAGDLGRALPARPNPFGPATTLAFSLPATGAVRLQIVDLAGRTVATLADGWLGAGRHEFTWTGRASGGSAAPAGVYFARLRGPGLARTERLVLVR